MRDETYLAELKPVPVLVNKSHELELGVKILLFVNDTQIVEAEVCNIYPVDTQRGRGTKRKADGLVKLIA